MPREVSHGGDAKEHTKEENSTYNCGSVGNDICSAYGKDCKRYLTATMFRENEGVIVVGANESFGKKAFLSNYGIRTVDVSAPGHYITSAYPRGMGDADPYLCPPVSDVSGNKAVDAGLNKDSTYFTYSTLSGADIEYKEDEGFKVLAVKAGMKNGQDFLSVKGHGLSEVPKYLMIRDKYGVRKTLKVNIKVLLNDGTYYTMTAKEFVPFIYGSTNIYDLPANVNTFNAEDITVSGLANNKSFKLQANLQPSTAVNKAVIYESSNPSAVTVNMKGIVKRVGDGSADIYVTTVEGGYTAVCHVK